MTHQEELAKSKLVVVNLGADLETLYQRDSSWFTEECLVFLREARQALLADCYRASMIVAGEALLRAVYGVIWQGLEVGKSLSYQSRGNVKNLSATTWPDPRESWGYLNKKVPFDDALSVLGENRLCHPDTVRKIRIVQWLRNQATHGQFPLLDEWDPYDPRDENEFRKLLRGQSEHSEGYRFKHPDKEIGWIRFECRQHAVGSLKPLSPDGRFAAITFRYVVEALDEFAQLSGNSAAT